MSAKIRTKVTAPVHPAKNAERSPYHRLRQASKQNKFITGQTEIVEIDAKGRPLGRLAAETAKYLQGKHKVSWKPHVDAGAVVKVSNARKIKMTGKKKTDKIYWRHSGYPGGIYGSTWQEVFEKDPRRIVEYAVWGMLPKNKSRKDRMKRLIIEK
jgi:large subunit ribosomal protein L13